MKAPRLLASIATFAISMALTTVPASANEAPVIDYCAKKTTGKIRAITEGACTKKERRKISTFPQQDSPGAGTLVPLLQRIRTL
jgi:hypothetical protein